MHPLAEGSSTFGECEGWLSFDRLPVSLGECKYLTRLQRMCFSSWIFIGIDFWGKLNMKTI